MNFSVLKLWREEVPVVPEREELGPDGQKCSPIHPVETTSAWGIFWCVFISTQTLLCVVVCSCPFWLLEDNKKCRMKSGMNSRPCRIWGNREVPQWVDQPGGLGAQDQQVGPFLGCTNLSPLHVGCVEPLKCFNVSWTESSAHIVHMPTFTTSQGYPEILELLWHLQNVAWHCLEGISIDVPEKDVCMAAYVAPKPIFILQY